MEVNWSFPSSSSVSPEFYHCSNSSLPIYLSGFVIVRSVLTVPFTMLVFYLIVQRRQKQRSFKPMSHSDVITCHMSVMQLIGTSGFATYLCGFRVPYVFVLGVCLSSASSTGEVLFHVVTCVERYLAVVHPIAYLRLKKANGVRNICAGVVWLFSLGWISVMTLYIPDFPVIPFFCFLIFSFIVVSFCSLSVLCVLIRPGPGEVGGDREQVDPLKQKAFYTILAITGVLWFLFVGYLICIALDFSTLLSTSDGCMLVVIGLWLGLPSTLVVPLLFLLREGKLSCCTRTD